MNTPKYKKGNHVVLLQNINNIFIAGHILLITDIRETNSTVFYEVNNRFNIPEENICLFLASETPLYATETVNYLLYTGFIQGKKYKIIKTESVYDKNSCRVIYHIKDEEKNTSKVESTLFHKIFALSTLEYATRIYPVGTLLKNYSYAADSIEVSGIPILKENGDIIVDTLYKNSKNYLYFNNCWAQKITQDKSVPQYTFGTHPYKEHIRTSGEKVFWLSSQGFTSGIIKSVQHIDRVSYTDSGELSKEKSIKYFCTRDSDAKIYMGQEVPSKLLFDSYEQMCTYYTQNPCK